MATQFVNTGGRLVIKTSAGAGSSLFDGTCGQNVSYRASTSRNTAQCMESAEEEKYVSLVTHDLSGTFFYQTSDTTSLLGLPSTTIYSIYLSQNGTTLFAGSVLVDSVEDSQGAHGTPESVSVSLTNDGTPDVGFGV